MKNFSQTFVNYQCCGIGYSDGTNKIVPEGRKCIMPTYNLFGKIKWMLRTKSQNQQDHKLKRKQRQKEIIRGDTQNM